MGALARYNFKHGGNLNDPAFVGLERIAAQKFDQLNAATEQLKQAQTAARRAAGKGGFPPPAPKAPAPEPTPLGCPPNCGNDNPTIPGMSASQGGAPSGALEAGSTGVASSFYPVPSFPVPSQ
jgi:hypothetical protein